MKEIYLVYNCDEWKSSSSMGLRLATTSEKRLKEFLIEAISDEEMEMDIDLHVDYIISNSPHEIDKILKYGYIEVCEDGEEL